MLNILDLVITSGTSQITATAVKPTTLITDHNAVECELHQPKPKRMKRHVQYRKYAAIDNGQFAADLEASDIHTPEVDPTALFARYDSCLRLPVDDHAPIVSRTITVMPMTPWYTSELSVEKRDLRRAERVWRESGLTVHRQIYTSRRNHFRTSLKKARSEQYLSEIKKAGGNMRSIYKISNALFGRDVDKTLPEGLDTTHAELATRFQQQSFTDKVDALCCKRSQQPADDRAIETTARLHVFDPASPSDVKRIVMTSASKSCELDPLPTSLLKTHIDFLCPVLARISNTSLSSAVVPPPMKHAAVTLIPKKRCSDVIIPTRQVTRAPRLSLSRNTIMNFQTGKRYQTIRHC